MNTRKIVLGAVVVVIGLPTLRLPARASGPRRGAQFPLQPRVRRPFEPGCESGLIASWLLAMDHRNCDILRPSLQGDPEVLPSEGTMECSDWRVSGLISVD